MKIEDMTLNDDEVELSKQYQVAGDKNRETIRNAIINEYKEE
jgi:hypothetical protein